MLTIEIKEDSQEKLVSVQGKPTKYYLFSEEFNAIVQKINEVYLGQNPNRITGLGTETVEGNQYTYQGYSWIINGADLDNIDTPSVIVIPTASVGFRRKDISVFTSAGTIERVAGTETDGEVVTSPDVPEGTLYYKSYDIDGDTIEVDPEPPAIDGSIYKKKIENTRWKSIQSGTNVLIPFQPAGQSHYSVVSSGLISVAGFTTTLLTAPLYEGQDVLFENQTGNSITLKDSFGAVPVPFDLGADLVVPNKGKLWFRFRNGKLELIMKSWIDVDLSSKADLVGGKVPSSQLPSYVDDVLEYADFDSFPTTGETGIIYVALDNGLTYRWSGSAYVQIGGGEKQIFSTPGAKYNLATISSCYSTNVETGFGSDLINASAGNIPTAMGIRWVLPLFISEKNQKLKEVNIRITNATFPTLRLVIFTGLSVNGSNTRINNQIIHDQNYTLSGGNIIYLNKITSFTNDVTIPIGYDLCFYLIRVDGTNGTLNNFQISGYAS